MTKSHEFKLATECKHNSYISLTQTTLLIYKRNWDKINLNYTFQMGRLGLRIKTELSVRIDHGFQSSLLDPCGAFVTKKIHAVFIQQWPHNRLLVGFSNQSCSFLAFPFLFFSINHIYNVIQFHFFFSFPFLLIYFL